MAEVNDLSSKLVLDRLGHEELRLKQVGLAAHAMGMRAAIVAVIRLVSEGKPQPDPIDPEGD